MSKLLLIDGDMVAYRAAASCEPTKIKPERESLDEAIFRANDLLYRIIDTCASNEFRVFLSGGRNFRKQLDPQYKANRDGKPQPAYLDSIRELLVREWNAELCDGYEADDGIGMAREKCPESIIVSNDKDFRQLGGEIFNPVRNGGEFEVVDSVEAARAFYSQMLEGDTSDNIRGVDGIGKVRAGRLLADKSPEEMHSIVYDLYGDPRRFLLNYRLLRILRDEKEYDYVMDELAYEKSVGFYEDWKEREAFEATVSEIKGPEPTEESSPKRIIDMEYVDGE